MSEPNINEVFQQLASAPGKLQIFIVEVSSPVCGDKATVTPGYPGACTGSIDVSGTAEKADHQLSMVEVVMNGGSSMYDISPTFDTATSKWNWSVAGVSGAHCECPGSNGNNSMVARAYWEDPNSGGMGWLTEQVNCGFTGECSTNQAAKQMEQASASAPIVEPTLVEDGWLEYRNMLPDSPLQFGKILGLNGRPLCATLVAVHATDIRWAIQGEPVVRRAIGEITSPFAGIVFGSSIFGREPWRFHDIPRKGICLFQPGGAGNPKETRHSVLSETPTTPDIFNVIADQPLIVRINDSLMNRAPRSGGFTLRVKVLG